MFSSRSRYARAGTYPVTLPDGTVVTITRIPRPTTQRVAGWYPRSESERLDVVAYRFLGDPTRAWVLCDANGSLSPDALAAHDVVAIPVTGR